MSLKMQVESKDNGTALIAEAIKAIAELDVLVGVPQESAERKSDGLSNAELVYIHTHGARSPSMIKEMEQDISTGSSYSQAHKLYVRSKGSPLHRIPARPIIEPAIEDSKKELAEYFKASAEKALNGDKDGAIRELHRAGLEGRNVVRRWFTNPKNNWAPNSPRTIEQKGSDNPLIDTSEMRRSIIYVVRKKG